MANVPSDDFALVAAMKNGDQSAMTVLYDRYSAAIMGLALRITRERADAEDVVVDTFAQVWRDASRFEAGRGSVGSWVATIARSRSLDLIRSRGRRNRLDDVVQIGADAAPPAMGSAAPSPIADVLADERCRRVQDAMAGLPDVQRKALELAYFGGLSQSEIAEQLDEPLGTVKTRMRLGLRRLRESLASMNPEGAQ
jgi:RNA polymerase sigma-70 factor, ECF subfamily